MECVQRRDDANFFRAIVIVRIAPGELERGFVRFRTRVAQEHALGEGGIDQLFREPKRRLVGHPVGHMPERLRLVEKRLDDRWMTVTEGGDGHSAREVDVHPPLLVPDA